MHNDRSNAYREIAVQTSSPTRLVVMLYEGAIRFLRESVVAIESRDLNAKRQSIDRAVAVVQHLQGTLDMERGGAVALDLARLYDYITSRILDGSSKLETAPLEEAIKLLKVLMAGWEGVAERERNNPVLPALLAQPAGSGGFKLHA
jgi:flagellar secretion chaperone FliS